MIPGAEAIQSSWPWEVAFSDALGEEVLAVVLGRWLGSGEATGGPSWAPPGAASVLKGSSGVHLKARMDAEDARALDLLRLIYLHASCRLARDPQAFGAELPDGYAHGERVCSALGDEEGAGRARSNHQALGGGDPKVAPSRSEGSETPAPSADVAALLRPDRRVVKVYGEKLEYALLEPDALVRAVEMLQEQGKAAGDPPHSGLVGRLGTSRWTGSSTPGASRLLDAERLVKSLPSGPGRLGPAEGAVEASIQGWKAGLRVLAKSESAAELDGGGVALLERWYRRALYRDLGLLALSDDDAEFALVALEEAAEARGRVRPGPGLDPLLLAGLAHARYKSNELQRSVVLLEDMAQIPGWEVAGFAAQTVARVAVLGSTADAKVNR